MILKDIYNYLTSDETLNLVLSSTEYEGRLTGLGNSSLWQG